MESELVKLSRRRRLTDLYNLVNTALSCATQSMFSVVYSYVLH